MDTIGVLQDQTPLRSGIHLEENTLSVYSVLLKCCFSDTIRGCFGVLITLIINDFPIDRKVTVTDKGKSINIIMKQTQ